MNRCVLHVIPPGFKKINYMMRLVSIFSKRGLITQFFFLWWWCFLWRPLTSPYSASVIFNSYRKVIHFLRNYQKAHASPYSTSRKLLLLSFFFRFQEKKVTFFNFSNQSLIPVAQHNIYRFLTYQPKGKKSWERGADLRYLCRSLI